MTKDFDKSPVYWLNGLSGTAKSTIAQTAAERLAVGGIVPSGRGDLRFIFPGFGTRSYFSCEDLIKCDNPREGTGSSEDYHSEDNLMVSNIPEGV